MTTQPRNVCRNCGKPSEHDLCSPACTQQWLQPGKSRLHALCRNCHRPCKSLFCSLACAEERYSIVVEALDALEATCRRTLGMTPKEVKR